MPVVLCYGDSNTHGTPPMADLDTGGRFGHDVRWPGVMADILGRDWTVIEAGLPGRTTVHDDPIDGTYKNGLTVLPAVLHSHKPLDLVVIMLGTNDLKARFSLTAADIAAGCGKLIETVLGAGVGHAGIAPKILLVAPTPIAEAGILAEMFTGGAAKSLLLAERMRGVADRMGVAFFDAGRVAAVDPLDGIHFASETQVALGHAMADAVQAAFHDDAKTG